MPSVFLLHSAKCINQGVHEISSLYLFIEEDFFSYEFYEVWKCERAEGQSVVQAFFESKYFLDGIEVRCMKYRYIHYVYVHYIVMHTILERPVVYTYIVVIYIYIYRLCRMLSKCYENIHLFSVCV